MVYESEIHFTLDTICPWTYLAKRRLTKALASLPPDSGVKFTTFIAPYQLFPEASQEGEDKYQWYKKFRYHDSEETMQKYTTVMTSYGTPEGISFKFGGTVANTTHAHRLIQHFQATRGPETASRIVDSLYRQYFEEEKHPSSDETLLSAAVEAGVPEEEAKAFIADKDDGLQKVKMAVRQQAGNQVDAVPLVVIEGKRRDLTLLGAKEVQEYEAALQRIIKESG